MGALQCKARAKYTLLYVPEKMCNTPLPDWPNIERDRRRSVSQAWKTFLGNLATDATGSVAALEKRNFANPIKARQPAGASKKPSGRGTDMRAGMKPMKTKIRYKGNVMLISLSEF